ncbi:MAG: hypothetical protein GH151_11265 [Bacteroidetes bacterium]|nr:hypothetical protein [Bacteroidota bacterium]
MDQPRQGFFHSSKGIAREENTFGTTLSGLNENSQGLTVEGRKTNKLKTLSLMGLPSNNWHRITSVQPALFAQDLKNTYLLSGTGKGFFKRIVSLTKPDQ